MRIIQQTFQYGLASITLLLLSACSDSAPTAEENKASNFLSVYKKANCGCCGKWVKHIQAAGFKNRIHNQQNLAQTKNQYGINPRLRACHTSVSGQGFVFEGHIPAKFIQQFLNDTPEQAVGLAVAGMPLGTPGMKFGERFTPYEIYLMKSDHSVEIYAEINTAEEQI